MNQFDSTETSWSYLWIEFRGLSPSCDWMQGGGEGQLSARCFRRKLDSFSQTHSDFSSNNTEREREMWLHCLLLLIALSRSAGGKKTNMFMFTLCLPKQTVNKQQKQDSETFKVMKRKTWNWSQITVTLVTSLINNQINNIRKLVCLIKHRSVNVQWTKQIFY